MKEKLLTLIKSAFPPPGSNMQPYEWMIKATPQKEWIDEKGIYLWLAFFFTEIGAGLYFVSMFFQYITGMALGWVVALAVGGGVHMLYLGNPKRFWRIFMKPGSSELSRGVRVITIFSIVGFVQMVAGAFNPVVNVIMAILCILVIMHGFATMNVMRALPAWNSTMVLPLSIVSGVWVGSQMLQFMLCVSGSPAAVSLEVWSKVLVFVYIGFLALYLWGTFHTSDTARISVNQLLKGDMAKLFYIGVVAVGLVLPLLLTLIMWGGSVNAGLVFLRLVSVFVGDLLMRYTLMKSAVYTPLV